MIEVREAQEAILERVRMLPGVDLPLLECRGRVLAEDAVAPFDMPPADTAAMDGYAFAAASWSGEPLPVTAFLPAGGTMDGPAPGAAVKIMTGARVPQGCDTVVPVEEVAERGAGILLVRQPEKGSHIRLRGEDVAAGSVVVHRGSVLRAADIAMLAATGCASAPVHAPVSTAVISTGDELLEPGAELPAGTAAIFDSNRYGIAAQVLDTGAIPHLQAIVPDRLDATAEALHRALRHDVVISSGGASVGDRDYLKEAIRQLGGEIIFWKVNVKPGKPTGFALVGGKPLFALPGNPVAAMVTFDLFVRPALLKMMGHRNLFREEVPATLAAPVSNKGTRPHYMRVFAAPGISDLTVTGCGTQSSAALPSLTKANALLAVPPETAWQAGTRVTVTMLP